jgi:hypothetical protein
MSKSNEFEKALEQAQTMLSSWRKNPTSSSYPDEVLLAIAKAARLGNVDEVARSLRVCKRRVFDLLLDPRFSAENLARENGPNVCKKATDQPAKKESTLLPAITFTQIVPVEKHKGRDEEIVPNNMILEFSLPSGAEVRVFDGSPTILSMVKDILLTPSVGVRQ